MMSLFESLAPALEAKAGGPVHLIRIKGPRWSFVAGRVPDDLPCVVPQRVMLNDDWALLFYTSSVDSLVPEDVRGLFKAHGELL